MHPFVPQCGECFHCVNDESYLCAVAKPEGWLLDGTSRVKLDGEPIAVMTFLGNMAEYAVVPAICTARIEKDVDFKAAAESHRPSSSRMSDPVCSAVPATRTG